MDIQSKSLRSFLGSRDYSLSRAFYSCLGFKETILESNLSLFTINENLSFYLQDAYVNDWIENTMIFWEVKNLKNVHVYIKSLSVETKFKGARVSEIVFKPWGNEFFVHDPSGILWHVGEFK